MNDFRGELPDGGSIALQSDEEVEKWESLKERYIADYRFVKVNDLTTLGSLLQQHILHYRAQQRLSGMTRKMDDEDLPTGEWEQTELKPAEITKFTEQLNTSAKEIRELEKALGIDKKSREQSGSQTIPTYIMGLKDLGRRYGIHISERTLAYEEFVKELTWRLRLNANGDTEDQAYHECTPDGILKWARAQIDFLEGKDKEWAEQVGKVFVGRI